MTSVASPIRGILFMVACTLIFAVQDGLSKQLASAHSPIFITTLRYWFFGAVVLGEVLPTSIFVALALILLGLALAQNAGRRTA